MNDEFLHALRRDPPPEFARELQRRLQRLPARRSAWSSVMRTMLAVFMVGGIAMAAAMLLRDRREPIREEAPIVQAAAPQAVTRAALPAGTPQSARPAASDRNTVPQQQAQESEPADVPVALISSSLTRPLADALAEHVSKLGPFARTRVMSMDDDEAFRALCGSIDFIMTSRRIADAELAQCRRWGIDVVEWKLGFQAVVLTAATSAEPQALTPREVFLALARRIPDPAEPSRLIDNPNTTWHDVDPRFDYANIDVLAPADDTTRALFVRLVMEPGCETYPSIRSLKSDRSRYYDICHGLRSDGRYREVALTYTHISQHLGAEPSWLVVLGYSYYADVRKDLLATMLEGPAPTAATLTDGTYPAARPVYVYGQRGHLEWSAGQRMFAFALTSEQVVGPAPHGLLARYGLVPLDDLARRKQREEHAK